MFELIVVFSALTAPVPMPIDRPADYRPVNHQPRGMGAPPLPVLVQRPAAAHTVPASSAVTSASHSASSEPVAGARLARAYQ